MASIIINGKIGKPHEYFGCPFCKSSRIIKRFEFHLINKYRCKKCHKIFRKPKVIVEIY